MKLYNISEDIIKRIVKTSEAEVTDDGKIIYIGRVKDFIYPIKVIGRIENSELWVISAYPLKRRN